MNNTNQDTNQDPFRRDEFLDKPGIVGARWWHEGLAHTDPVGRRSALKAMLVVGGLLAVGGLIVAAESSSSSSTPDWTTASRNSLEMQKEYGWNFGAATEALTFDGATKQPFVKDQLTTLPSDLRPTEGLLRPYFIPTLFQSPSAVAKSTASGEDGTTPIKLSDALKPIFTPLMDVAYRRGKALASLFDKRVTGVCVVVDLPGPESVAFAAGAAATFEPVFAIDNWPHPRGVVPAHLTLAAAAYYQPLFVRMATARAPNAPAMFVLDRKRLSPYADETTQFDNRHVARLPTSANLGSLGYKHVLYVTPLDTDAIEQDDVNDDFVHYKLANITVKLVGANAFGPDVTLPDPSSASIASHADAGAPEDLPIYYYGNSVRSHDAFWVDYPFASPARAAKLPPQVSPIGKNYVPIPRSTAFSTGSATGAAAKPQPANFGMVPIVIVAATGVILGAKLSRSGSWNRSSGGWGG